MAAEPKQLTDFLIALGIDKLPHSGKSYLAHLIAVKRDLQSWGCEEDVCLAGMFHSIYGTEMFQGFTLPLERREALRALIGPRAERLAYLNCAMDRTSFDENLLGENAPTNEGPFLVRDRIADEPFELARRDFDDLCRVHLCDWLEQVSRSGMWDYREKSYAAIAARLGGVAEDAHRRVYSAPRCEPA